MKWKHHSCITSFQTHACANWFFTDMGCVSVMVRCKMFYAYIRNDCFRINNWIHVLKIQVVTPCASWYFSLERSQWTIFGFNWTVNIDFASRTALDLYFVYITHFLLIKPDSLLLPSTPKMTRQCVLFSFEDTAFNSQIQIFSFCRWGKEKILWHLLFWKN